MNLDDAHTFVVRRDVEEGAQRVIDYVMLVTTRRHDVVEFCVAC
jgi:hypothetical protein